MYKNLCVLMFLVMHAATAAAADQGPLAATLEARKVVAAADGRETALPAEGALPGDLIEYRATYRNNSDRTLRGVVATLPIPAQSEFVPGTESRGVTASLDGKTFGALPLMRRVRTTDGREMLLPVPAAEYRFLRWTLGDLGAKGAQTVSARVRIANGATTVAKR